MADVLIAEDIDVQATLIRRYLSDAHTVVDVVSAADDVVDAARTLGPDVVVMDLNLERGSGIEAMEAIRASHSEIAVVVSSVSADPETRERAFEAGAAEYLVKPYDQQALLDAIDSVT